MGPFQVNDEFYP